MLPSPALLLDLMQNRSPQLRELTAAVNRTIHNPCALERSGIDPGGTTLQLENGWMDVRVDAQRRVGFLVWFGRNGHSLAITFTRHEQQGHFQTHDVFVNQPERDAGDLFVAAIRARSRGLFEHEVHHCDSPGDEARKWFGHRVDHAQQMANV